MIAPFDFAQDRQNDTVGAMRTPMPTAAVFFALVFGISQSNGQTLSAGKVLLGISLKERERLNLTNVFSGGNLQRDWAGRKLRLPVTISSKDETDRVEINAEISATEIRIVKKSFVQELSKIQPNRPWVFKQRLNLPRDAEVVANSEDWIVISNSTNAWLAKITTPDKALAYLPTGYERIDIYNTDDSVHVFSRTGSGNREGPMHYRRFQVEGDRLELKTHREIPWARVTIDMDADAGIVILNDNKNFWGRTWLFDLNSGKRKWIRYPDWLFIVDKDLAKAWNKLSRP